MGSLVRYEPFVTLCHLRRPSDLQRESEQFARTESQKNLMFMTFERFARITSNLRFAAFNAPKRDLQHKGVQFGNPEVVRANQATRVNLRIHLWESGHLSVPLSKTLGAPAPIMCRVVSCSQFLQFSSTTCRPPKSPYAAKSSICKGGGIALYSCVCVCVCVCVCLCVFGVSRYRGRIPQDWITKRKIVVH